MIQVDWRFIEQLEGFSLIGYVPQDGAGRPLGKSGATIASGIDLGQWSEAQLRAHRVPERILDEISPYLGVTGHDALEVLQHRPLTMSREDARMLTDCIRGDIVDDLVRRYDAASDRPFRDLPPAAQTVIVSVGFQFGSNLAKATPNFWRQVVARDWPAAYANLMAFGDKHPTRRRKEAALLADLL